MFVAPTLAGAEYADAFSWLMAAFGVCCLVLVALSGPPRFAVAFVAVSPLLIGAHLSSRFDLWPTALTLAAVAAFLRDRHRLGWAALAAGFAAKLFPALLMPLAAFWTLRRRGSAELARALGVGACVAAAAFVPFLLVAPRGVARSLWGQFSRPLQIESLAASFIMTFGHPHVIASHGSLNLSGRGAIAAASALVSWLAILAIWVAFARGPAERDRFVRYAAASLCAFIAFGKVLSPQFLIWLVPLVPLIRGRRGILATGLLAAALIDTEIWFPARYFAYVYQAQLAWLVLVRDLLLVLLFLVLSLPRGALLDMFSRVRPGCIRRARPRFAPPHRRPPVDQGTR
jgi:uncharacterized membrane protein